MKLSPPFAHNEQQFMNVCLNENNDIVLVTDELVTSAYSSIFDDSVIIRPHPGWATFYFPGGQKIDISKWVVGDYIVRAGFWVSGRRRIIVSDGELTRIPANYALV